MEQSLNSIINTNVLDIDKKRPDYIYLKYSIYKESLAEINDSQKYDKVSAVAFIMVIYAAGEGTVEIFVLVLSKIKLK